MEGVGALAGVEGRARAPARRINLLPPPFAPSADAVAMIASMGFAEQVRTPHPKTLPVVWPKNSAYSNSEQRSGVESGACNRHSDEAPHPQRERGSRNNIPPALQLNIEHAFCCFSMYRRPCRCYAGLCWDVTE